MHILGVTSITTLRRPRPSVKFCWRTWQRWRRWDNHRMQAVGDFCAFEKAVEHLADRWSFLIVRELALLGPRGFNALADGLPGVSRSVLARRLRKLEDLGIIVRIAGESKRGVPYRLSRAGRELVPTLRSLSRWAERWAPEDPAAADHDPDVITFWVSRRAEPARLPDPSAVLVFQTGGPRSQPVWLVLERDAEPSICIEDPLLPEHRYVHVEADAAALYPISRGQAEWQAAIDAHRVRLFGEPSLIRALPGWFRAADERSPSTPA
jgi:DNA-binding HxlR family transcriptional regulator